MVSSCIVMKMFVNIWKHYNSVLNSLASQIHERGRVSRLAAAHGPVALTISTTSTQTKLLLILSESLSQYRIVTLLVHD